MKVLLGEMLIKMVSQHEHITEPRAATGNGQTGQLPPPKFLQTRWHSRTSHEKLFLETALPLREVLKTTLSHTCCVILDKTINQSMYHASENSQHRTGDKLWGVRCEVKPVPSPAGTLVGLSTPKQSSKLLQIEIWNVINHCNFCQHGMSNLPLHKPKAPLLTTFWRRLHVKTSVSWKWRCVCKCDLTEQESICYQPGM